MMLRVAKIPSLNVDPAAIEALQKNFDATMRQTNLLMVYYALKVGVVGSTFSFSQTISWTIFLSMAIYQGKIGLASVHHDFKPEIDFVPFKLSR
jgi:hypothetical protein